MIINIISFLLSYVFNLFYIFNAFVPLLWIPYVLYKIFKKELKTSAINLCIIPPIFWFVLLFILTFIAGLFKPVHHFVNVIFLSKPGYYGAIIAFVSVIFNILSPAARKEFSEHLELYKFNCNNVKGL